MTTSKTDRFATLFAVSLLLKVSCATCPLQCQCLTYSVKCIQKGLRTIPQGLPLSARSIDLSHNPDIKIPRDYFLQFSSLFTLSLRNCGQSSPVYLPNTVTDVRLDRNSFSVNALRQMLSTKLKWLKRITLEQNHLQTLGTETVLKILPAGLTVLNMNGNEFKKLTRDKMLRFKNITTLYLKGCSMDRIEANTFDHMRNLFALNLESNRLSSLPNKLFKFNVRLSTLVLNSNRLTEFNATKLGLQNVNDLRITDNRIVTFDVQTLQPFKIMLNNNNIQGLDTNIFRPDIALWVLSLSYNNITYISRDAFRGIHTISHLLMNNNSLHALPQEIFKGITLSTVFLQHNKLSTFKGAFNGIDSNRVTVILTGNKRMTTLDGGEFQSLSNRSKIYLNCDKMTRLSNLSKLNASVICFPQADENISISFTEGFPFEGYQCNKYNSKYKCTPCRPGYHSENVEGEAFKRSKCVSCPPGFYYQDQAARHACKICRPGQFVPPEHSPGKHATDCRTCPEGTDNTIDAGTRACKCLRGYFRRYRFGRCDKCSEKGFNCSLDYQVLRSGFWMTWQGTTPMHPNNLQNDTSKRQSCECMYKAFKRNLDIMDDTYDKRTMHFNCEMPLPIKCPLRRSCVGGKQPKCSAGYIGVLCAVCKGGYSRQFNQCAKCGEKYWAAIQSIVFIASFALCSVIIQQSGDIDNYARESARSCQTNVQRTFADILLSSLKILIGFYQVLISIIHALAHVNWPENLRIAINILHYIQFQIIDFPSLRCVNSEWSITAIGEFWIIIVILITVPLLSVSYYCIKSLYIHFRWLSQSEANKRRHKCGRNCIRCVSLFLFLTYTLTSTKIIQILPVSCHSFCTAKRDGTCVHSMSFLRSDYSIPCPTINEHEITLAAAYVSLSIPIGLPILLYFLLRWYAPRPQERTQIQYTCIIRNYTQDEDGCSNPYNPNFSAINGDPNFGDSAISMMASALKFTHENYHSRCWYWEVIEMIRKLLMTIGAVLFVGHTKIGLTCTLILAMAFTILHAIYKPFKSKFESGAQFLSLILIPMNLVVVAVLQSQDTESPTIINKDMDSYFLGMFLIVINSSIFIAIVARLLFIICTRVGSNISTQ